MNLRNGQKKVVLLEEKIVGI